MIFGIVNVLKKIYVVFSIKYISLVILPLPYCLAGIFLVEVVFKSYVHKVLKNSRNN